MWHVRGEDKCTRGFGGDTWGMWHVRGDEKCTQGFGGTCEGEILLGRPRCEGIILKWVGGVNWIVLAQDRGTSGGRFKGGDEYLGFMKRGYFILVGEL